jgi:glycosyltransferase involved in cell wall biosynthesis
MTTLSVVIITKNEEKNLPRCLKSVHFADEIIVIDSGSTDRTIEIAQEAGAKVYRPEWRGFGPAKQEGVDRASSEWILSLDADEELTPELAAEIQRVMCDGHDYAGFRMPRRTRFLGRWIYHCGWYPDYLLRLFRKAKGGFDGAIIHEQVRVDGTCGRLKGEILHYSYPSLENYLEKFNFYTTIGAEQAFEQGKTAGVSAIALKPIASFIRHYIIKRGFLDGVEGLTISVLSSISVLVKYAKLRELRRQAGNNTDVYE